jgi:hypothetical protein
MVRLGLIIVAVVLFVTGVSELIGMSRESSWTSIAWAGLAVASGAALFVGAWRSDAAALARLFGRSEK